jgi:hypothetical protein
MIISGAYFFLLIIANFFEMLIYRVSKIINNIKTKWHPLRSQPSQSLKTNSQIHGILFEKRIQKYYAPKLKNHSSNAQYDIPAEQNEINNRNISVKCVKQGKNITNVTCGDIRFINSSNVDLIIGVYEQQDEIKKITKTYIFDLDIILPYIVCRTKTQLIPAYVKYVKNLAISLTNISYFRKIYLNKAKKIQNEGLLQINPKVSRSKNINHRVQCSFKIENLLEILKQNNIQWDEKNGAQIYDYKFDDIIISGTRERNNKKIS